MPSWPSTLPPIANLSVSKSRQSAKVRTEMDAGVSKQRSKYTGAVKTYGASMVITGAQLEIFESFYENDLAQGSASFNWLDLSSRTFAVVRFVDDYELSVITGDTESDDCDWMLSFQIEIIPGQALFWQIGDGESLSMDFVTREYAWRDKALTQFEPGFKTSNLAMIGFTRSDESSFINQDGYIEFTTTDKPAYTYDEDGNNIGLIIRDSSDNIIDESENFNNWTASAGITRTPAFDKAPFAGEPVTAYRIQKDATSSRSIDKVLDSPTVNRDYVLFALVKKDDLDNVSLLITGDNGVTIHGRMTFDFNTEALTNAGSTNLTNSGVVKFPLGYYGIFIAATLTTVSDPRAYIYPGLYNGTTAGGVIVAGAMANLGIWPLPYIRTAGASAIRPSDFLNKDDLGELSTDEGTIYLEARLYRHSQSVTQVAILRIANNHATFSNTLLGIQYNNSGGLRMFWRTDASSSFINIGGAFAFTNGQLVKIAISYKKGGQIIGTVNGQTAVSSAFPSGEVFTQPLRVCLGDMNSSGGTGKLNYSARYLSKFKYYPTQKLAAELEAMTV